MGAFLRCAVTLIVSLAVSMHGGVQIRPEVSIIATPDGGIQPQAQIDHRGTLHLLYFKGPSAAGDLYYVTRSSTAADFTRPLRVNSVAGSAIATGSVRGGQLALGANDRVHVSWYGSTRVDEGGAIRLPMWYARLNDAGTGFEPQRNVAQWTTGLDGGAVATDHAAHVYVAWHGLGTDPGEQNRTVYVARSVDEGRTFRREERGVEAPIGACGCCGLRALVDGAGTLHVLYRTATDSVHRDATWLRLPLKGAAPAPVRLHPWEFQACPMSTFALANGPTGIIGAWQTAEQIFVATLDPRRGSFSSPMAMEGEAVRKHPSVAVDRAGNTLVAWTEGTAWARGGTLAWALYDPAWHRLAGAANAGPVPVWGLVSAVAPVDGSFLIVR
jgi:hypothetical protein